MYTLTSKRDNLTFHATFETWYFCFSRKAKGIQHDPRFFTAGNKWYKVKYRYLGNNGTRMTFFKTFTKTNLIALWVTEQYNFILLPPTAKNHFKLMHNDMKGVSAGACGTNYFQRLTLESWYTNLQQTPLNRCQQALMPYKRLIHDENETDKWTSNRRILLTIGRSKLTNEDDKLCMSLPANTIKA